MTKKSKTYIVLALTALLVGRYVSSRKSKREISPKNVAVSQPRVEAEKRGLLQKDESEGEEEPWSATKESRRIASRIGELARDRQRLNALRKGGNPSNFGMEKERLKAELRTLEEELVSLLESSEEARKEYLKYILDESDSAAKSQIMMASRRLDPTLRGEMAVTMAESGDPKNRLLGVQTFQFVGNPTALKGITERAVRDSDPEVRMTAVKALGRFSAERVGENWSYGAQVNESLRELAGPQSPLDIREAAFRGLIGRAFLSPEDKAFVSDFADRETDPGLREIALAAKRGLASRRR